MLYSVVIECLLLLRNVFFLREHAAKNRIAIKKNIVFIIPFKI